MTYISSQIFVGMGAIPENADAFSSQEFDPSKCSTQALSIIPDLSATVNPNTGRWAVLGGNKSGNVADMVTVRDENGTAFTNQTLQTPFVKQFFPFKYIAIQYSHTGDAGAGTVTFYYEQKNQKVTLS